MAQKAAEDDWVVVGPAQKGKAKPGHNSKKHKPAVTIQATPDSIQDLESIMAKRVFGFALVALFVLS